MKKILIVDDDPALRTCLREFLEMNDYEVSEARNGEEALNRLDSAKATGILLLDLEMPSMSGHEVLKSVRDNPNLQTLPVILMTALQVDNVPPDLYQKKISKPFDLFYLVKHIDRYCACTC